MQYNTLDQQRCEIRVLVIHPPLGGDTRSAIRCTSRHLYLDQDPPPEYHALSYVWGSNEKESQIRVDDDPIAVTRSLAGALFRLRKQREELILWVDAVCINQDDVQERNQQVEMMGLIYRKAAMVLTWLNLPQHDGDLAAKAILQLFELGQRAPTAILDLARIMRASPPVLDYILKHLPNLFDLESLAKTFSDPYWSRVWIVQELRLARHVQVYCGSRILDLDVFLSPLVRVIQHHTPQMFARDRLRAPVTTEKLLAYIRSCPAYNMLTMVQPRRSYLPAPQNFTSGLLGRMAGLHATDPRDKVFGFLGVPLDPPSSSNRIIESHRRRYIPTSQSIRS